MQGADLFEANLENANLAEATLQGANLYLADLRGADVQRASLQRALVKEANLQETNLHGANLQGANLQGADIRGADLQGSNLQDTTLHHTNMRDLDLSDTAGLLAGQLAGAIIAGARLPARLQAFDGLTTVKVLVQQSRKLLTLLCFGCACAWLVLASTTDARLLTNASIALLPHLSIPIPSQTFARVIPMLLLGLFLYLHLHLHRLWEELAELPAVFPDGRPLDKTAYPWFFHSIVRAHVWCLRVHRPPLSRLCTVLTIGLAWWLVPGTLALFWIRYLPGHDWLVTVLHMTLLVASIGLAIFFQGLARAMLRGHVIRRFQHGTLALLVAFACDAILSFISFGALTGIPPYRPPASQMQDVAAAGPMSHILRQLVSRLLTLIGASPFANFVEAEVSTSLTPMSTAGKRELEHVKGANLLERNLRYANAARAFLARADLRRADLSGADLRQADLRGARLDGAELFGTNLQGADLSFATGLTREQLANARLDTTTRLPEERGVLMPPLPSAR